MLCVQWWKCSATNGFGASSKRLRQMILNGSMESWRAAISTAKSPPEKVWKGSQPSFVPKGSGFYPTGYLIPESCLEPPPQLIKPSRPGHIMGAYAAAFQPWTVPFPLSSLQTTERSTLDWMQQKMLMFVFFRFLLSSGLEGKRVIKKRRASDLFPLLLLFLLLLATPQGHRGSLPTSKRPGLLWGLIFAYFCIVSNPGLVCLVFDNPQLRLWKKRNSSTRTSLQVFV